MACRILPRPEHLADLRAANDDVYRRLAALPGAETVKRDGDAAATAESATKPCSDSTPTPQSQACAGAPSDADAPGRRRRSVA